LDSDSDLGLDVDPKPAALRGFAGPCRGPGWL